MPNARREVAELVRSARPAYRYYYCGCYLARQDTEETVPTIHGDHWLGWWIDNTLIESLITTTAIKRWREISEAEAETIFPGVSLIPEYAMKDKDTYIRTPHGRGLVK